MQPQDTASVVLDERYRLDAICRDRGTSVLWRATDEVLGRAVALQLVTGLTKVQTRELEAVVASAGLVADARWVRILDTGSHVVGRKRTTWVVTEWVEGRSLAEVLRDGPMAPVEATALVLSCAHAVAAAHREGLAHGWLHPGEILIAPDGSPRLTGLERGVALQPDRSSYDDTLGLGAVLFAALTGCWPLPGWSGLPRPTRGDGTHPRQLRSGITRDLDQITSRALAGGYSDPEGLARALSSLPVEHAEFIADDRAARQARRGRVAWRVIPPLVVVILGLSSWAIGRHLGRIPGPAQAPVASVPQAGRAHGVTPSRLVWSTPPLVRTFEPGGRPQDPGGVGLAVDGDPSTSWVTNVYHAAPQFIGDQAGVGLLLDLGHPVAVKSAQLLLSESGAAIELRASNTAPHGLADLPVVAADPHASTSTRLKLARQVTARYWLVWVTTLPKTSTGYQLGIAEIALLRK